MRRKLALVLCIGAKLKPYASVYFKPIILVQFVQYYLDVHSEKS